METFMQQLKAGTVAPEEVDNFIDAWRNSSIYSTLSDFLGMTQEEFKLWVKSRSLQEWYKALSTLASA